MAFDLTQVNVSRLLAPLDSPPLPDFPAFDVPRPVEVVWSHSEVSRRRLGAAVSGRYLELLREAAEQDASFDGDDRLTLRLG